MHVCLHLLAILVFASTMCAVPMPAKGRKGTAAAPADELTAPVVAASSSKHPSPESDLASPMRQKPEYTPYIPGIPAAGDSSKHPLSPESSPPSPKRKKTEHTPYIPGTVRQAAGGSSKHLPPESDPPSQMQKKTEHTPYIYIPGTTLPAAADSSNHPLPNSKHSSPPPPLEQKTGHLPNEALSEDQLGDLLQSWLRQNP
ncbi:hypothetical protein BDP27DRAFT_1444615 [Rhodocollybia butyracea]|uniref:Uncharacterized protein n=1 Tax=Rhodocollybia butyracea TaxID=206335 RepID=A0A9P5UCD6_9AGAR|nr:hypothetical protein BDP27DRAFT_1444615 [Rhodocollybia butyracea]